MRSSFNRRPVISVVRTPIRPGTVARQPYRRVSAVESLRRAAGATSARLFRLPLIDRANSKRQMFPVGIPHPTSDPIGP